VSVALPEYWFPRVFNGGYGSVLLALQVVLLPKDKCGFTKKLVE
jgi:hypothetical protein